MATGLHLTLYSPFTINRCVMNMQTYGVNTLNSGYVDVSNTLLGAKQYATRNGYNEVYVRYNNGYHINKVATKTNGKWSKV